MLAFAITLLAGAALPAAQETSAQDPAAPIEIEPAKLDRPADFERDILPLLKAHCLACHNPADKKGGLVLESPEAIIRGGDGGPAVVPGKADESLLLKVASRRAEPHMPPPKNKAGAAPLSGAQLGLIKLWIDQGAKGEVRRLLEPPLFRPAPAGWNPIFAVALDAGGEFAACGRAGRLALYHVPTRRLIEPSAEPAHPDAIQAIAFSPDGSRLATGGYRAIKLWKKELPARSLKLALADPKAASINPDGARIAVAGPDHVVTIFETTGGAVVARTAAHGGPVSALRFSSDGKTLLSGSADKFARLFNAADGAPLAQIETPAPVTAVTALGDGSQIAAAGADNVVRVYGREKSDLLKELKGHGGAIAALLPAPELPTAPVSVSQDGRLVVWNLENAQPLRQVNHGAALAAAAVSADGKRAATLGANNAAKLWNLENGQTIAEVRTDGPAKRADRLAAAILAFAGNEVQYRQNVANAAAQTKTNEEAEVKKASDAIAGLQKDVSDKQAAHAKTVTDRQAADAALAGAVQTLERAKKREEVAVAALAQPDPDAALKAFEAEKAAVDKAAAETAAAAEAAKKNAAAAAEALAASVKGLEESKKKADEAVAALAGAADAVEEKKKGAEAAVAALGAAKETETRAKSEKATADRTQAESAAAAELAQAKVGPAAKFFAMAKAAVGARAAEAEKVALEKALAEAMKAADLAKSGADACAKASGDAKTALEAAAKVTADAKAKADAAAKAVKDAGEDEAKKKEALEGEKAAKEALTKAEADAAAADQAFQKAEKEKVAAEKATVEAAKKRDETKAKFDAAVAAVPQAVAARDKARAEAEAEKNGATQAVAAATEQHKRATDAQAGAKKNEENAARALDLSNLNLEAGNRRVERAKEAVARAEKAIQEAGAKLEAQKQEQQKLDAARKAAAEALAKAQRPMRAAAISPDGSLLVVGDEDGKLHTFAVGSGEAGAVVEAHAAPVIALAFAPDGSLVSLAADGSVRAGAVAPTWKLEREIKPAEAAAPPIDRVTALEFSPDGALLASGGGIPSREGELVIWNTADGAPARRIDGAHSDVVYDVAFSPDGTRLASGGADKFARLFEVATGKPVGSFEGHTHHVLGVSWNRTGRTLATAGADGAVKLWDLVGGQQIRTIGGFDKQVTSVAHLGYDARFVVSAGATRVGIVREDGNAERNFDGVASFMYAAGVSADGALVAAGGFDGVLRLWRAGDGAAVAGFPAPQAK
jgi:WD40 repeat protein